MEFTDFEKALLRGAPVVKDDSQETSDLEQNYENLNLKDMSYFHKLIGNSVECMETGVEPSQFAKWQWIHKPKGVAENEQCLLLAASCIKSYILVNYIASGEGFDSDYGTVLDTMMTTSFVNNILDIDGEGIRQNTSYPALVAIASKILDLVDTEKCLSAVWWKIRLDFLHQKLLEEKSPALYSKIKDNLSNKMFTEALSKNKDLETLFYCEMVDIFSYYYDITAAKETLANIQEANALVVETCGVLGRRTKYQTKDLPQLVLKVSRSGPQNENYEFNRLPLDSQPKVCKLTDDTRLDKIAVEQTADLDLDKNSLTPLDYVHIFANFVYIKVSQPKDGLSDEELSAFLSVLTDEPLFWCLKVSSLYYRSMLESNHRRTVERSLEQLQILKAELTKSSLSHGIRYQYFFASRLPTSCEIEISMADVEMSLGSTKSALETYIKFQVLEKAIHCYHKLDLKHKVNGHFVWGAINANNPRYENMTDFMIAFLVLVCKLLKRRDALLRNDICAEELIRNELEKKETVKLWILLGDATDDVQYYEKAWEFSNHRSGRAQRQWAFHYFHRKEYVSALPHFAKSVELNSLEYEVWFSYAYALMETKNWGECVKAYLSCINMNYDNFEAWNNIAVAYRNLKQIEKALNALLTAAKCDYEVWKVWENILTLGMECNSLDDVLTAYNRLLDIKSKKYIDETALCYMANAILTNQLDCKGQQCARRKKNLLTLLGKVTASEFGSGTAWSIYSDLILMPDVEETESDTKDHLTEQDYTRSLMYAEKAARAFFQKSSWMQNTSDSQKIIECVKSFLIKVEDVTNRFPNSSSLGKWITTAKYLFDHVKRCLEVAMDKMIQAPKEYSDLLQVHMASQERLNTLLATNNKQ